MEKARIQFDRKSLARPLSHLNQVAAVSIGCSLQSRQILEYTEKTVKVALTV